MNVLVVGMTPNPGGVENVIMNYYRNINNEYIKMDFICFNDNAMAYEDEVLQKKSRVIHMPSLRSFLKYNKSLKRFFEAQEGKYDVIWVNLCTLHNLITLKFAEKYNIPIRIIHAHNSKNMSGIIRGALHWINRNSIEKYATDFWSCSEDASRFFYPNKIQNQVRIISNGIDIDKFIFNDEKRVAIRKKLGLDKELLIGNVGRLHFQKNQKYLIDVFRCIYNKNENARLVLVGQGPDEEILKKMVKEIGLEEYVFFVGVQNDIQAWLSAMDVFCFPSMFEGLPVVALEVQANGLATIASKEAMPQKTKVLDNFDFYSLNRTPEEWAEKILTMDRKRINEEVIKSSFEIAGFDIKNEARKFEKMLLERYKREKR